MKTIRANGNASPWNAMKQRDAETSTDSDKRNTRQKIGRMVSRLAIQLIHMALDQSTIIPELCETISKATSIAEIEEALSEAGIDEDSIKAPGFAASLFLDEHQNSVILSLSASQGQTSIEILLKEVAELTFYCRKMALANESTDSYFIKKQLMSDVTADHPGLKTYLHVLAKATLLRKLAKTLEKWMIAKKKFLSANQKRELKGTIKAFERIFKEMHGESKKNETDDTESYVAIPSHAWVGEWKALANAKVPPTLVRTNVTTSNLIWQGPIEAERDPASTVTNTNIAVSAPTTLTTQSPTRVENEQEQAGTEGNQVNLRNHEESVDTMSETGSIVTEEETYQEPRGAADDEDDDDSVATAAVESTHSPPHIHTSLERCREPCMVVLNNITSRDVMNSFLKQFQDEKQANKMFQLALLHWKETMTQSAQGNGYYSRPLN
jgi:hypothetical protein